MAASTRELTRSLTGSMAFATLVVAQVWLVDYVAAYYLPQRPDTREGNIMYNQMLANQVNPLQLQRMLPHAMAQPVLAATRDRIASNRRQDFDDEESDMDQNASAPYQNQPDDNQGTSNDGGYDDNEPDGASSYQETPRDQESQSDLERFFDDHLGASDKDGMDKENLPTNWSPVVVKRDQVLAGDEVEPIALGSSSQEQLVPFVRSVTIRRPSELDYYMQQEMTVPLVWRRQLADYQPGFMTLPDSSLIQNPQVPNPLSEVSSTSSSLILKELEPIWKQANRVEPSMQQRDVISRKTSQIAFKQEESQISNNIIDNQPPDHYESKSSDIVLLRADDYDEPVYMTNQTDKPFRIAALGNFDPEADFEHASREIDHGDRVKATASNGRKSTAVRGRRVNNRIRNRHGSQRRVGGNRQDVIDRSIDEMDKESMSEDASETDEVTFGQDEPYQTDLEAEMKAQDYDRIGRFSVQAPTGENSAPQSRPIAPVSPIEPMDQQAGIGSASVDNDDGDEIDTAAAGAKSYTPVQPRQPMKQQVRDREFDTDDSEGSWVNDGADDMEVPSQAHQNMILEKAAQADQAQQRDDQKSGNSTGKRSPSQQAHEDDSSSMAPNHVVDTGTPNDQDRDNDRR